METGYETNRVPAPAPERQFLADLQAAYDRYVSVVATWGREEEFRIQEVRMGVASLVGKISRLDWEVRNDERR